MNAATLSQPWISNATALVIAERVKACRRLTCFTHSKPDGDAIGSTLALVRAALHIGKQATAVYLPPFPERFRPLLGKTPVLHGSVDVWSRTELTGSDAIGVLDTGSWNQVEDARAFIAARSAMTFIVDHHAHGHAEMAPVRFIETTAASCCEMVAEVCRVMLGLKSCRELPADIAEALYLGAATDTGWFRYSNTTPRTLRLAADLIDAGAPHNELFRMFEQSEEPSRLRLLGVALSNLKLLDDNRVAVIALSRKDIEETGASVEDAGGLSDLPNTIATVKVVATLIEYTHNLTKLSLRSKPARPGEPLADVNKIAQQFGGGGHVHASGAKLHMTLAQAEAAVTRALTSA